MKIKKKINEFDPEKDIIIILESEVQINNLFDFLIDINYNFNINNNGLKALKRIFYKNIHQTKMGFRLRANNYGSLDFYELHEGRITFGKPIELVYMSKYSKDELEFLIVEYLKNYPKMILL